MGKCRQVVILIMAKWIAYGILGYNGDIEGISEWKGGLKHGKWTAFYKSGQIQKEFIFMKENLRGKQLSIKKWK